MGSMYDQEQETTMHLIKLTSIVSPSLPSSAIKQTYVVSRFSRFNNH